MSTCILLQVYNACTRVFTLAVEIKGVKGLVPKAVYHCLQTRLQQAQPYGPGIGHALDTEHEIKKNAKLAVIFLEMQ